MAAQQPSPAPPAAPPPAQPAPAPTTAAPAAGTSQPLSLAGAQAAALQQVSALRQAEYDEAAAAEELRQARAALLPRVRDEYTVTYNSPERGSDPAVPSFIAANAVHEYQNLTGVAGEVNAGMLAGIRRARALLNAARAGTAVARRALFRGVTEAYFGAALARARRAAAEQSFTAAEEFERVTRLNYEAGEVPEVDWIRARLQTAARRDELLQARNEEAVANAGLGVLLGAGGAPNIEALPQTVDANVVTTFSAEGVGRRPELAQASAQVQAARAGIGVARSDLLPRITYSVDRGFDTDTLMHDELRRHRGTLATAMIDIPLFDWGLTFSRIHQAQLQARAAEAQRELTSRGLYVEYATARQQALTAAARIENARSALADAERNVTISIERYRAGEAPISEATDAQTTRAQQRLALQQALFDYQIAIAHLREAAGE
ncbi:MAG TPA: TolC family protein [Thermoanaerobaculia bacterium]|nr:TolC family protein [Thermoanaerobaculia bacterium]